MTFAACLPVILATEGGYVDDPSDPGGATNAGITIGTLSQWMRRGATIADVKALTPQTISTIYHDLYWTPAACDDCPVGVDLMVFDTAVNMGVGTAVRFMQGAAGVVADGHAGPLTLAAVKAAAPIGMIEKIAAARVAKYRSFPTFARYGDGWIDRVSRTQKLAEAMVQ